MKIYFRTDGNSLEYSLDEFDKEELSKYRDFKLGDDYSERESQLLCDKMINKYKSNGITLTDI